MPDCSLNVVVDINDLERIQRLATRLANDIRHLPYEEGLQRPGLHSLQRLLDFYPILFFLPPTHRGLRGPPSKVLHYYEPPPKERVSFFGEGREDLLVNG